MMNHDHTNCKCHKDSPFRWKEDVRTSIFYDDKTMRPQKGTALSKSQISSQTSDRLLAEGKVNSTIYGMSRDREAELLRLREFKAYSRAKRSDLAGVEVMENGNVSA